MSRASLASRAYTEFAAGLFTPGLADGCANSAQSVWTGFPAERFQGQTVSGKNRAAALALLQTYQGLTR